jgi:hypothetical protein
MVLFAYGQTLFLVGYGRQYITHLWPLPLNLHNPFPAQTPCRMVLHQLRLQAGPPDSAPFSFQAAGDPQCAVEPPSAT